MSTWHQERNGYSALSLPGKGYVLITEGLNVMRTSMGFGEVKDKAFESLEAHRKNQPRLTHLLYLDGRLIA